VRLVGDNEKIQYTVNSCGNAAGDYMPPFILFKSKRDLHKEWTENGPENAIYATSPSGWMETEQFIQWFKEFVKHVREIRKLEGPIILCFDGHKSHISIDLIDLALANNIRLNLLPPHSSHEYQPMDVGVFGPAKVAMKKIVTQFYVNTRFSKITKAHFTHLMSLLHKVAFHPEHIVAGFRKSGLYPLSKELITEKVKNSVLFETLNPASSTPNLTPSVNNGPNTSTSLTPIMRRSILGDLTLQASNNKETHLNSLAKSLGDSMLEVLRMDNTEKKSNRKTVVPRIGGECLTSKETVERLAKASKEKAEKIASQTAAKEERKKKKENDKIAANEKRQKREEVKKRKEEEELKKSIIGGGVGKRKYVKKNKIDKDNQENFSDQKCCFKCNLVYNEERESNKNFWRNCEFNLSCPNWYCPACLPPQTSTSSEVFCSKCQPLN
jgi:hypothetical protein